MDNTGKEIKNLDEADIHLILANQINETIEDMEEELFKYPQLDLPVKHKFCNGMYARELFIPKGTLLTGAVHKRPYIDIMISGDIVVGTPTGIKRLTGYNLCDGSYGRKRIGYAYSDTLWISVHRTDCIDPDMILDDLTFRNMKGFTDFWDKNLVLELQTNPDAFQNFMITQELKE